MEWQSSSGKFSINITTSQALECTARGDNMPMVHRLAGVTEIAEQLDNIKPEDLAEELRGFGAWSEIELADHGWNRLRILWIACHDLIEEAAREAEYDGGRGD